MQPLILVVEDDANFQGLLVQFLEHNSYRCLQAGDGVEALRLAREASPDLVLLDLRLPRKDGWEVCRELRQWSCVPIIILTGVMSEVEKVRLLRLGADDFLFKPPKIPELLARMEALLRRASMAQHQPPVLQTSGLVLDTEKERAIVDGVPVRLTHPEWRILCFLAQRPGELITPNVLLEHLWGPEYSGEREYVYVHMSTLRSKLQDDAQHPRFIETVTHQGYRFLADP